MAGLEEIQHDLQGPHIMQRLIQGDVGSGKTIIAFLCMALMGENGAGKSTLIKVLTGVSGLNDN